MSHASVCSRNVCSWGRSLPFLATADVELWVPMSCGQWPPISCISATFSGAGLMGCCGFRRCCCTIIVTLLKGGWKERVRQKDGVRRKASSGRKRIDTSQLSPHIGHSHRGALRPCRDKDADVALPVAAPRLAGRQVYKQGSVLVWGQRPWSSLPCPGGRRRQLAEQAEF